ncbi:hypothetical protein OPT61_g2653 [Boeremia exigua]|uniref:Uncharacterized protein n=1 Tax=Boeremia exigua TaxID=749465 RepID=A0ACC2IKR5_9PLEO|nr:hypothetical protein OPT61_g2653 [Boeremia exigua]
MLTTAWVCRSCLLRVARPLVRRQLRHQSSAASESVPPALLTRARNIAIEHKALTEKLANGFDTKSAKKLGEYSSIVSALQTWDRANESFTELTSLIHDAATDAELRDLAAVRAASSALPQRCVQRHARECYAIAGRGPFPCAATAPASAIAPRRPHLLLRNPTAFTHVPPS